MPFIMASSGPTEDFCTRNHSQNVSKIELILCNFWVIRRLESLIIRRLTPKPPKTSTSSTLNERTINQGRKIYACCTKWTCCFCQEVKATETLLLMYLIGRSDITSVFRGCMCKPYSPTIWISIIDAYMIGGMQWACFLFKRKKISLTKEKLYRSNERL